MSPAASGSQRLDLVQPFPDLAFGDLEVIGRLQVDPELRALMEQAHA